MPGIVGIVSRRPAHECTALVEIMIASMLHESFYVSGTSHAPELGVYGGWVAHEGSFAAKESVSSQAAGVAVLFSGECYSDAYESIGDQFSACREAFVSQLNGLFAGLVFDHQRGSAFLFNDRYGFDRVYVAEVEDALLFASEAKALLAILPQSRAFDDAGVADFLAFGCTTSDRTLFRGISLLPAASCWTIAAGKVTKRTYFNPSEWENQDPLSPAQFERAFEEAIAASVPKYFAARQGTLGISLTAGLDSRVLLAARPASAKQAICYTYDGAHDATLDSSIAAAVAGAAGYPHQQVRLGDDFFPKFASLAERTVYLTDGTFGPMGAHELYLSRAARKLAPLRLTGVFGGEIFRGVSTFKPLGLDRQLLDPPLATRVQTQVVVSTSSDHPVTRAAFKEIPWSIFGSVASCRSQLSFRTPYLDNALVALAYRMPETLRESAQLFETTVKKMSPALAKIPTDMGLLGKRHRLTRLAQRGLAKATFKLDYLCNDGMPHWVAALEPTLETVNSRVLLHGRHKYLSYRRWFRRELAAYVRAALKASSLKQSCPWNEAFVGTLADQHISGRANFLQEINAVLTLDAVERCFFSAKVGEARQVDLCQQAS